MKHCFHDSLRSAVQDSTHLGNGADDNRHAAGSLDFTDGRFLKLCRFARFGFYLKGIKPAIYTGYNIGNPRRAVHPAMFFPAEAVRHGLHLFHDGVHDVFF